VTRSEDSSGNNDSHHGVGPEKSEQQHQNVGVTKESGISATAAEKSKWGQCWNLSGDRSEAGAAPLNIEMLIMAEVREAAQSTIMVVEGQALRRAVMVIKTVRAKSVEPAVIPSNAQAL
jgi:hypothetical protein